MAEQSPPTPVAPSVSSATAVEEPRRPDPLAISVATEVARMRREAGLSERAAARKLGTSQTQLRRMEDPRYLPSLRSLARVATAYGYKVSVQFASIEEKKKRPAPERAIPEPKPKAPAVRPTGDSRRATARRAAPRKGRARPGRSRPATRG